MKVGHSYLCKVSVNHDQMGHSYVGPPRKIAKESVTLKEITYLSLIWIKHIITHTSFHLPLTIDNVPMQ